MRTFATFAMLFVLVSAATPAMGGEELPVWKLPAWGKSPAIDAARRGDYFFCERGRRAWVGDREVSLEPRVGFILVQGKDVRREIHPKSLPLLVIDKHAAEPRALVVREGGTTKVTIRLSPTQYRLAAECFTGPFLLTGVEIEEE